MNEDVVILNPWATVSAPTGATPPHRPLAQQLEVIAEPQPARTDVQQLYATVEIIGNE